ncbi:MAG: VOC family protein [Ignisphaera sp.]|uniref:Glyoxalase n=1 Tax=Ignisphaera aggregans TaxID=334771 RepID=A0A7J3N0A9_9CREN
MTCTKNLKNVVQIGIVVDDIEDVARKWCKILGLEKPKIIETDDWNKTKAMYRGKPAGKAKLAFIELDNIVIELIEPIDGDSTWSTYIKNYGQGVHHIAFKVENVDECIEKLKDIGGDIEQLGYFENGIYIYMDTRKSLGTVIELLKFFNN